MPWKRLEGQAIVCALRGKRDRMRLFLHDHVGFMILQLIQCVIIPVLFWFDGYRGMGVSLYAIFLSFVLLTSFLIIDILVGNTTIKNYRVKSTHWRVPLKRPNIRHIRSPR